MYREFGVTGIYTSLIDKKIDLEFTLDVHPDTATLDAIALTVKANGRVIPLILSVNRNVVTLELQEWPQAGTEYVLRIQSSNIRSIVDDELPDSIQRTIVFKSEVLSTVDILSPSHHEELFELHVTWEEQPGEADGSLVSSFYLEIAKENAFYNLVRETFVADRSEIRLADIEPGQYYVRVRAQKGNNYGRWSDVITFIVAQPEVVEVEEEEIFQAPLRLIRQTENGETPGSFIFEFDRELNPDIIPSIKVRRRMI